MITNLFWLCDSSMCDVLCVIALYARISFVFFIVLWFDMVWSIDWIRWWCGLLRLHDSSWRHSCPADRWWRDRIELINWCDVIHMDDLHTIWFDSFHLVHSTTYVFHQWWWWWWYNSFMWNHLFTSSTRRY